MVVIEKLRKVKRIVDRSVYVLTGRRPWSRGYNASKFAFIKKQLRNNDICEKFLSLSTLPQGYGYAYDERVVEYPWTLMRLNKKHGKLLDAGSVFNFAEIVEHPKVSSKDLTIFTLAPEYQAFWYKGISYQYGDLRSLPFRDEWFDEICSLSTLGHIGMDNRIYTNKSEGEEIGLEAEQAVRELLRVLKPNGRFLISVVFGKHQFIECQGAPYAEQFDSALLKDMLNVFSDCEKVAVTFYKYSQEGWNVSTEKQCADLEYYNIHVKTEFDNDMAAAARAVALIDVIK